MIQLLNQELGCKATVSLTQNPRFRASFAPFFALVGKRTEKTRRNHIENGGKLARNGAFPRVKAPFFRVVKLTAIGRKGKFARSLRLRMIASSSGL